MYQELIKEKLQLDLDIPAKYVENVINFLNEGCTIPFIARYRKEWTGSMSDEKLRIFSEKFNYYSNFYDRLDTILRSIEEQGKLTDEIKNALNTAKTLSELEDIYRPFKPKKATRASKAKEKGLEPLATYLLLQVNNGDFDKVVASFINEEKGVKNVEDAIQGAKDIIAEMISDEAKYRKFIRNNMMKTFQITTKKTPKGVDEREIFNMYYDYSESLSKVASHRILAINRGEKLGILKVELTGDDSTNTMHIASKIVKKNSPFESILLDTIEDAYKRLIKPSIDNEILSDLTEISESTSIEVFKSNLKELLLEAPT